MIPSDFCVSLFVVSYVSLFIYDIMFVKLKLFLSFFFVFVFFFIIFYLSYTSNVWECVCVCLCLNILWSCMYSYKWVSEYRDLDHEYMMWTSSIHVALWVHIIFEPAAAAAAAIAAIFVFYLPYIYIYSYSQKYFAYTFLREILEFYPHKV